MNFTATITVIPNRNLGSVEIQGPCPDQWAIHRIEGPRSFSLCPSKGTKEEQLIRHLEVLGAKWARFTAETHGGVVSEFIVEVERG